MGSKYERVQEILDNYKAELQSSDQNVPAKVQQAVRCIHEHLFDSRLTVGWMRKKCRINGHSFSSRFNYYVGKTPKKYILSHRMESAKQLLANKRLQDVSISTIVYEMGFSSPAVFSNAFKGMMGESPSV